MHLTLSCETKLQWWIKTTSISKQASLNKYDFVLSHWKQFEFILRHMRN